MKTNFKNIIKLTLANFLVLSFIFAPVVVGAATVKNAGKNGLVGYWPMNEGVGTRADDISGNGNTGTINGGTWSASGRMGKALNFNGSTDYVAGNGSALPNVGTAGNVTITAWIKPNTVAGQRTIFSKGASGNCFNYGMTIVGGVLRGRNSFNDYVIGGSIIANQWQYVSIVFSPSGMEGFVNGVSVGNNVQTTATCADNNWVMGTRAYNATPGEQFSGLMDDVRIYNRTLSQSEILTLYKSGGSAVIKSAVAGKNGLVGHWSFNEGVGSQAGDASGLKNNGSLVGSPTWVSGKLGKALRFNGVDNYVDTSTQLLSGSDDFMISAWVKSSGSQNTYAVPISQGHGAALITGFAFQVGYPYANDMVFIYGDGGSWRNVSFNYSPRTDYTWHLLTVTKSGNTITTYKDGISQNESSAYTLNYGSNNFSIGRDTNNTDSNHRSFNGVIDDVRIYNRVFSSSEILDLYKSGGQAIANASRNNILTNGLVGLWSFDGKDMNWGTNKALDRSGQGNDGVLTNMSTTTSPVIGKIGQGLKFDGVNDHINLGTSATFNLGAGNFTLCSWFKTNKFEEDIVANGVGANGNYLLMSYLGKLRGHIWYGGNSNTIDSNAVVNNDTWQHGCQVVDSTNIYLYINGSLDKSQVLAGAKSGLTGTGVIGHRSVGTDGANFDGTIDDVRIYNRALSASEISSLYRIGR
jgi:hypothetical protein